MQGIGQQHLTKLSDGLVVGLTARQNQSWKDYGNGRKLLDAFFAQYNFRTASAGNTGTQMGGWYRKEIKTVADLKGLKMRIPGLGGDVMAKLGASPVSLPGGQIYENLVSGAIDATEWVGTWNVLAFGLTFWPW